VLLELCCLEEEDEKVFTLPILRVQAPLYGRGWLQSVVRCPAAGFPVVAVLGGFCFPLPLCLGASYFIKSLCSLDRHIRGICARLASDPFVERGLLSAVGGGRAWLASLRSPASAAPIRPLQSLIKHRLQALSSSPAWASSGEDHGRLLAQLALKPASLAGCHGDPWDVSRQVALP
jgi:hypothetical protein